jgi:hypothetical protein
VIRSLWAKVRELDDLTSDVLLYCLCFWATRTSSPGEFVWISADRVLDERGVQRKRYHSEGLRWQHGHRRDDRLAVWQALVRLKDLWIEMLDVEVLPARRQRKAQFVRVESPLLLTDARMTQHDLENSEASLAAQVAPGRWARELWEVLGPQTGLLARKALDMTRTGSGLRSASPNTSRSMSVETFNGMPRNYRCVWPLSSMQ